MSVNAAYSLYAAKIGSAFIDQMENQNYDAGIEAMLIQANGQVYNQFAAIGLAQPKLSFDTSNLFSVFTAGMLGYQVGAGLTNTTAVFYWRQFQAQGGYKSGNFQESMTMHSGLILPRRLTANTGERAVIQMEVLPLFDGTNTPFVVVSGVALPAGSPAIGHVHTAGPCILNGVKFSGIQNLTIDFGIKEMLLKSDGEGYNSFIGVPKVDPVIEFETYDLGAIAALGQSTNITSTTTFFLTAVQSGGMRYDYSSTEHMSVGVTAGMIYVENAESRTGEVAKAKVKLQTIFDGTNLPITFNTATAIVLP